MKGIASRGGSGVPARCAVTKPMLVTKATTTRVTPVTLAIVLRIHLDSDSFPSCVTGSATNRRCRPLPLTVRTTFPVFCPVST